MIEQAWIDDVLIHDVDDPALGMALRETDVDSGPEPTSVSENRPRTHGSRNSTRFYGPRTFMLAGYVSGRDSYETEVLVDQLKTAFLLRDDLHELRFRRRGRDEDEALNFVAVGAFEAPAKGYRAMVRWSIALEAPDPRLYSALWQSVTIDPSGAVVVGGLLFPLKFPLSFRGSGGGGTVEGILVGGSIETPPVLQFDGPGRPTQIVNETTGEAIVLVPTDFTTTDVLIADVGTKQLTVNGFARPELIDAAQTVWWQLQPNIENNVRLLGTGFAAGDTTLTIRYREARS